MRRWLVVVLVAACGRGAPATTPASPGTPSPTVPRLRPPPTLDPDVRGSGYLAAVALQLQPGWGQFLDDCRLRLPATHALNDMGLAATAELAIDPRGQVSDIKITSSGNADFDRAVRDALRDTNPLPAPPHELWSDDDRVHLRWLFARDRRQAGPATAAVVNVDLPVESVVDRLILTHDLGRAARRIAREPATNTARGDAIRKLAVAGLREAIESSESTVRRAAIDAIGRAGVQELAPDVRALLTATSDAELRVKAIEAAAALGDDASATVLREQMPKDLLENERIARAEMEALVALHHESELVTTLRNLLEHDGMLRTLHGDVAVLEGVGLVAIPELKTQIGAWTASKDARTRAAACSALASQPASDKQTRAWLLGGMADRDASVRAACAAAVRDPAALRTQMRRLLKDRDALVRAAAVRQLAGLADETLAAATDASADVRVAYASTLAPTHRDVLKLLDDLDPDVRAAAWRTFAKGNAADKATLAEHAVRDPAEQVRAAAVPALADDAAVAQLAKSDVSGDVRTAALVELAGRRGRASVEAELLQRFAEAAPGSAERVRTMLAWLLAR